MLKKTTELNTMKYYSVIKRNELSSHEKTWKNFKCLSLGERSQPERAAKQPSDIPEMTKLWRE